MTPDTTPLLIIDDDPDHCFLLEHLLMLENIPAVAVHDLETAEQYIRQHLPRQIILDNHLPDGSGIDFLNTIMAIDGSIQVIMATADNGRGLKQKVVALGGTHLFIKPYDHRLLVRALQLKYASVLKD